MPKLREYNGVVYKDGEWYNEHGLSYRNVFQALSIFFEDAVDEDHIALLDLKNNPYEPIQTLEDVVNEWNEAEWVRQRESEYALQELCKYIREAFPDIDKPFSDTLGEKTMVAEYNTVQDHVDALVRMGAKYYSGEHPFMEGYPRLVLPKVK
jgi:hypothetical protein